MANLFRPKEIIDKYDEFDIDRLRSDGFNTILLDVDNTITPYFVKFPDEKAKEFVKRLKDNGFEVIVFSNNKEKRVKEIAESIDCVHYSWAFKPLPFKFNKVIKDKKLDRKKVICMGDQLLTDTLGGNTARVYTIYVKPISEKDSFTTAINRKAERFIFKNILHEEM